MATHSSENKSKNAPVELTMTFKRDAGDTVQLLCAGDPLSGDSEGDRKFLEEAERLAIEHFNDLINETERQESLNVGSELQSNAPPPDSPTSTSTPMTLAESFARDEKVYRENLPEWLKTHEGDYVAIRRGEVLGFAKTRRELNTLIERVVGHPASAFVELINASHRSDVELTKVFLRSYS